jgi:hypothetical protein
MGCGDNGEGVFIDSKKIPTYNKIKKLVEFI